MSVKTVEAVLEGKGRSVTTVPAWSPISEASALLTGPPRIGALVVFDTTGPVAGLLTEGDVVAGLHRYGAAVGKQTVSALMTHRVPTCRPSDELSVVLQWMTDWRTRHLPVLDGRDQLLGLISLGDVVQALLRDARLEVAVLRDLVISRS